MNQQQLMYTIYLTSINCSEYSCKISFLIGDVHLARGSVIFRKEVSTTTIEAWVRELTGWTADPFPEPLSHQVALGRNW